MERVGFTAALMQRTCMILSTHILSLSLSPSRFLSPP